MRPPEQGPSGRQRNHRRIFHHASPLQPRNRQDLRRHRPYPRTGDRGENHRNRGLQVTGEAPRAAPPHRSCTNMILYAMTILASAFLLFQVQPVIAKIILPWFGGSAAVWTTCLLFFQSVLVLGYLYAHATVRRFKPRVQSLLHAALLLVSALALPILPKAAWKPSGTEEPTFAILKLLAVSVGL